MRDQSEVIPGDYSPLRVDSFLGSKISPYKKTDLLGSSKRSKAIVYMFHTKFGITCLFVPNERNNNQVIFGGSGGWISPVNYIVK